MNDSVAAELLERYTPPALDASPQWSEVLERAGVTRAQLSSIAEREPAPPMPRRKRQLRRSFLFAAAAIAGVVVLATVTPARSAISRTLGDFSAWLTGLPGKPAPSADRDALSRASRSWAGFPQGTRLHRLLQTRIDGVSVALDGFRVGDSLCLQLVATGAAHGSDQSCAPLAQLKTQTAPALVLLTDAAFGTIGGKHVQIGPYVYTHSVRVDVTVGIVADGVERIDVSGTSGGVRRALVGGDAFIAIADRPPIAYRTNRAWATVAGSRVAIPVAEAPFDQLNTGSAKPRKPLGPSTVQRHVTGGSIAWLEQRQPRGKPVPSSGQFKRLNRGPFLGRILFQRLIAPDPNSPLREIVRLELSKHVLFKSQKGVQACTLLLDGDGAGGGCDRLTDMFAHGPVEAGEMLQNGGDQYEAIDGLVSDDVYRVELFLATGERIALPLLDNVFIAQVDRSSFPIRLVAYDRQDRRIYVRTLADDVGGSMSGPRLAHGAKWRTVLGANSPTGKRAKLRVAAKAGGGICWSFQVSDGSGQGGCSFTPWRGPALNLSYSSFSNTEGPAFIWGQAKPGITTVDVRLADGTILQLKPVHGLVLGTLPHGFRVGPGDRVTGYNDQGRAVAREKLPATAFG
jgi:hypothetical protein